VHFVDDSLDADLSFSRHCVVVKENDDEDSLAERILKYEHKCLPEAIRLFVRNRLEIIGKRVRIH